MRSSRRNQAGQTVSLFPFLAVLLCTMGALLVLLVVMSRQARSNALQAAKQMAAQKIDEADQAEAPKTQGLTEEEKELFQKQKAALIQRKNELEKLARVKKKLQLAKENFEQRSKNAQLKLGHTEAAVRKLVNEYLTLGEAIKDLESVDQLESLNAKEAKQEVERLNKLISETEAELDKSRKEALNAKKSYAIVPYKGSNGTIRRPIYIECLPDKVLIHPEGIELSALDFLGDLGPSNPLASALRAIRHYHTKKLNDPTATNAQPYPLILIRPGGIEAYYKVRHAIESWGPDFGYELIDAKWQLEITSPDPRLAKIVNEAIGLARTRNKQLARIAPRKYRGNLDGGYTSGGQGSSAFSIDANQLDSEGETNRGGSVVGAYGNGSRGNGVHGNGSNPNLTAKSGSPPGLYQNIAPGAPQTGPYGVGNTTTQNGSQNGYAQTINSQKQGYAGGPNGNGTTASGQQISSSNQQNGYQNMAGPSGNNASASKNGSGQSNQSNSNGTNSLAQTNGQNGQQGGNPNGTQASSSNAQKNSAKFAHNNTGSPSGKNAKNGRPGGQPGGTSSSGGLASSGGQGGQASSGGPSASASFGTPSQGSGKPIILDTQVRPRNAIAIKRSIQIVARGHQFAIVPEDRTDKGSVIPIENSLDAAIDKLATEIKKRMKGWGTAGQGSYWKPVLVLQSPLDGYSNARNLAQRLQRSGIEVQWNGATRK